MSLFDELFLMEALLTTGVKCQGFSPGMNLAKIFYLAKVYVYINKYKKMLVIFEAS